MVLDRTLGSTYVGIVMTNRNLSRVYILCINWERAKELLTEL